MINQTAHTAQSVPIPGYHTSRRWADQFIAAQKRIIANELIVETTMQVDCNCGADLTTINGGALHVACRVRAARYIKDYGDEFTIRDSRTSGAETELAEILSGYGTHLLYGFAHPSLIGELSAWVIGRLDIFREWIGGFQHRYGQMPGNLSPLVADGTRFRSFRIDDLPEAFVVARQYPKGRTA